MDTPIHYQPAHVLQDLLSAGCLTSELLVEELMDRIAKHAEGLKTFISLAPRERVLRQAKMLDEERDRGHVRSDLHGIPIVVKDIVGTDPSLGMTTSAGVAAFLELKAKKNSVLAQRLMDAGMIILGKTNMTELCGLKSNNTPLGWSSAGGQSLSAYRRDGLDEKDQPEASGSSSGSCVAVSAGFAPLAIGSDTSGSIIIPAIVHGVYSAKLNLDAVPTDGLFCMTRAFDAVGPIARDMQDLISLANVIEGREVAIANALIVDNPAFQGWKIGAAGAAWGIHESMIKGKWDQQDVLDQYDGALRKLKDHGALVTEDLSLVDCETLKHEGASIFSLSYEEFPSQLETFLDYFEEHPELKSLSDLIKWNEKNPEKGMPKPYDTQTELISANKTTLDEAKHGEGLAALRKMAADAITEVMDKAGGLDILLTSEGTIIRHLALAGWAHGAVPIGHWAKNGQPLGMIAIARDGTEDTLFKFMKRWEKVFGQIIDRPALH